MRSVASRLLVVLVLDVDSLRPAAGDLAPARGGAGSVELEPRAPMPPGPLLVLSPRFRRQGAEPRGSRGRPPSGAAPWKDCEQLFRLGLSYVPQLHAASVAPSQRDFASGSVRVVRTPPVQGNLPCTLVACQVPLAGKQGGPWRTVAPYASPSSGLNWSRRRLCRRLSPCGLRRRPSPWRGSVPSSAPTSIGWARSPLRFGDARSI